MHHTFEKKYKYKQCILPDFSKYSRHEPPLIFSRPVLTQLGLENFKALSEKGIPVYAHTALYESIDENLKGVFSNQVNIDEVMANFHLSYF